jgi:methyl-accepting chemotaxis protein
MAGKKSTKKSGTRFKILYQILVTMFIIALIPLSGLWYISIYKSRIDWTANIRQNLIANTEALTLSIDEWTSMNLRVLKQNAEIPSILSMDSDFQNPVLRTMTQTYSWVYLAFTVLPDGQNLGRSDGKPPKYYGDRNYFKQVIEGKDVGQQVLLGKTSGKPAFVLSKPIKDEDSKTIGVIAIAMSLEDLSKTVTKTKIGQTGFAILLDAKNRLIAHGKGEVASELQDFSFHPALKPQYKSREKTIIFEGKDGKIVSYSKKTKQGWTLIVQQDYEEAYRAANRTQKNTIYLFGVTCLIVIFVAYWLARRLSTPIRELTLIANQISRGKGLKHKLTVPSNDEIGDLYKSFDLMRKSIVKLIRMVKKNR